jgi:CBS domain containing-hemolysin-like protein
MTSFIIACILLILALAGVAIRKTYYYLPFTELKRRAAHHDKLAAKLYEAVAYEGSLRGLLWLFIAATSAGGFILLARQAPVWLSMITVIALLWAAFSWLPASRVTTFGARLTIMVTPLISWLLSYLHPLINRLVGLVGKRYTAPAHTGLYERNDLLQLIDQQQLQADSRLSVEELEIVKHVLSFPDLSVRDALTPRGTVRTVHANETVGPILIDELHQTTIDHVLVQDSPNAEIVGTLAVHELGIHSSGRVRDIMDHTVYYLHESDSLSQALHAFFVTNHPLFVVTNSFEEYVGIVTVQNILQQLIGHVPGENFDQYADLQAVAARHPRSHRTKKTADLPAEVIE